MTEEEEGLWVGVKRCGCVAAAARESHKYPENTEDSKREMLRLGLSVIYATRQEWADKYFPLFLVDCPHQVTASERRASVPQDAA